MGKRRDEKTGGGTGRKGGEGERKYNSPNFKTSMLASLHPAGVQQSRENRLHLVPLPDYPPTFKYLCPVLHFHAVALDSCKWDD